MDREKARDDGPLSLDRPASCRAVPTAIQTTHKFHNHRQNIKYDISIIANGFRRAPSLLRMIMRVVLCRLSRCLVMRFTIE
ncbi:hypothetical protein EVAR_3828_1 [Eumeta japonica]|uniref:Uncharacterized protein n=1 Tax=Eumeta variegata TaxID=151549 RepID=A0A4C1STQ2_EUMVA|nr:hypothetical protein EVAR_3828_1 [Eumeta japonica]